MSYFKSFKNYFPFYLRILKLAFPVILANSGQVLVMQADNFMVARLGTNELAAASFANSVFFIFMVLALGFSIALTPLVGEAVTQRKYRYAATLLNNSALLSFLLSLGIIGLMLLAYTFFDFFGQEAAVLTLAKPYFLILVASLVPYCLFFTLRQFLEGLGNTTLSMIVTLAANVLNVVLNYILIFGHLGFESMGLNGAGTATFLARLCMPIALLALIYFHPRYKRYLYLAYFQRLSKAIANKIIRLAAPISGQMVMEVFAFAFSSIMTGWISAEAQAAHQIALGLASISFMIVAGFSSGATIRVSHQKAVNNFHNLKQVALASIHMVLIFMSFCSLIFVLFRHALISLYQPESAVIPIAASLLVWAAIFQVVDGLQVVALGILRGLADVKKAMYYAFFAYMVVGPGVGYVCAFQFHLGAQGIWIGLTLSLILSSILFLHRFKTTYTALSK